ncbi:tRNA/rRNA methyltransferase SpoU type [Trinorchestia longiramus]|nr:tRNA/rRNA methyltransferase SpoU type [Trinorchestia longiramus]
MKPEVLSGWKAWLKFLPKCLLPALHDYQLFLQHCTDDELPFKVRLSKFFTTILCVLPSNIAGDLVELILSSLFQETNWEDVSLYHILASLTTVPSFNSLSILEAKNIALASQACWSSQEPLLREASQLNLIKILLSQIIKKELTLEQLCSILGSIFGDLSFLKDQSLWIHLVDLVSELKKLSSLSISLEQCDIPRFSALKIVLNLEVALKKNHYCKEQINLVLREIALSSDDSTLQSLEILCEVLFIIDQTLSFSEIGVKAHSDIMDFYSELFIGKNMEKVHYFMRTNERVNAFTCLRVFQKLLKHFHSFDAILASSTATKCLSLILSEHEWLKNQDLSSFKYPLKSKSDLYILQFISQVVYPYLDDCEKVLVLEILDRVLLQQVSSWLEVDSFLVDEGKCNGVEGNQGQLINGISKKEWRLHHESFTSGVWSCLTTLCEQANVCTAAAGVASLSSCGSQCLQVVLEWLPRVGRTSVVPLYSLAETLAYLEYEEWLSLVSALLSHSEEYGSSTDLLSSALTLLLQHERVSEQSMPTVIQACCDLLTKAQTTRGIGPLLARRLAVFVTSAQQSVKNYDWTSVYESVLVPLLLFGPIPDKKLKALRGAALDIFHQQQAWGTCGELEQNGRVHWSPYHEAQETRCHATLMLLSLDGAHAEDRAAAANIVLALRRRFNSANDGRGARDFSNSLPHRVKTRALQAIMVVLPLLSAAESGDLLEWVCCSTVNEQQQPSVRYLMEWMMALCVITWPELCPQFLKLCRTSVKQRPGSVASFLAAVSLLACHEQNEAIVEQCMTFAVPWCMAQQYNSRLYAQLAVSNIYQHCVKHEFTSTLNKFAALKDCLMISQAGSPSNTDDFFFSVFDPVGHYSVQTIYYELPRLSLLPDDEWLSCEELSSVARNQGITFKTTLLLSSPADHLLRAAQAAAWVTKAAKAGSGEALLPEHGANSLLSSGAEGRPAADAASKGGNMQRKVIPWSSLSKQQQQEALSSAVMRVDGSTRRYPLTVVASLLTKATNLGGLCRTCEVFGAGELVLPSMTLLHDQAFLGLSLSSHKWIPLVEVKAEGIKAYLRDQRRAGYLIVAVEQTAHSVSLSSFQFPARSLLLLGNEREGLPCSLLREVDVCVEIPQFGVTRSLNAHVAGSLCVWQYVNQHSSRSQTT